MARPAGLSNSQIGVARVTSGVIAADNATLSDANISPTLPLDCTGFDSIFVGVEITAGTNPTATLEPLFRDADAADGQRWKRRLIGSAENNVAAQAAPLSEATPALVNGTQMVELQVFGHASVFLRVTAVTNPTSTTAMNILVAPGKVRGGSKTNRN